MENSINERLKLFLESKKNDAPTLYKSIGATRNTWSGWMNEGMAIPSKKISHILEIFPELDARWLMTGDGQMTTGESVPDMVMERDATYQVRCKECEAKERIIDSQDRLIKHYERLIEGSCDKSSEAC